MANQHDMPWPKINDYLMEIAVSRNTNSLLHLALEKIEGVVPFDHSGILGLLDYPGKVAFQETTGGWESTKDDFLQYYCKVIPDIGWSQIKSGMTDWDEYPHTEYVTDFIRPNNLRSSAGFTKFLPGNKDLMISINRSTDMPPFSPVEIQTLDIIQGHLSNLCSLMELVNPDRSYPDPEDIRSLYPVLTRREAEITSLICQKCSAEMIGSKLLISTLTVYKHLENIYAKLKVNSRKDLRSKLLANEEPDI